MKTIVCYGDSNTWGYRPADGRRAPYHERWTGILQTLLGDGYLVYEEGMNARTTGLDDPAEPCRNGLSYLEPCLLTKKPVDLLVIMLGTNDTKVHLGQTAFSISKCLEQLIVTAQSPIYGRDGVPEILVVSPIRIGERIAESCFGDCFDERSVLTAGELAPRYRNMAELHGCHYIDAAKLAAPSPLDQLHLDKEGHEKLARAFYQCVKEILG